MTHKFVIELVDDYKGYEQDVDYLKRIYGAEPIKEHDKEIYNNAIDDFKKMLTIEKIKEYAESDGFINLNNCSLMIFDIAEQLKEGDSK